MNTTIVPEFNIIMDERTISRLCGYILNKMRVHKWTRAMISVALSRIGEQDLESEIRSAIIEVHCDLDAYMHKYNTKYFTLTVIRHIMHILPKVCDMSWMERNGNNIRRYVPIDELHKMYLSTKTDDGSNDCFIEQVLSYYEVSTFNETCQKYGIEPSDKNRKLFSKCCPKPEEKKGTGRGSGVKIHVNEESAMDLLAKYPTISRATAYRAVKTGYFYLYPKEKQCIPFSAITVVNELLYSQWAEDIKKTLRVSSTSTFYFIVKEVKYRVSNHSMSNYQVIPSDKWKEIPDIDVNPITWENIDDSLIQWVKGKVNF